jgi:hypothetical protein
MTLLTNLTQRIARSPGDPKVMRKGPTSLTGPDQLARTLAMFSFGLGIFELLAPGRITRALGLEGKEGLIRAYGAREISAGIPTFSIDKQVGLQMRLAGDALDIATVLPALRKDNDRRGNASLALFALIGITLLDVIAATGTSVAHKRSKPPPRDYSGRSGLPRGVEASRGLARRDFTTPADYHAAGTLAEALPGLAARA